MMWGEACVLACMLLHPICLQLVHVPATGSCDKHPFNVQQQQRADGEIAAPPMWEFYVAAATTSLLGVRCARTPAASAASALPLQLLRCH